MKAKKKPIETMTPDAARRRRRAAARDAEGRGAGEAPGGARVGSVQELVAKLRNEAG